MKCLWKRINRTVKIGIALVVVGCILLAFIGVSEALRSKEVRVRARAEIDAVLVVDISGSMEYSADPENFAAGSKLDAAKEGAILFVDEFGANDRIAIMSFSRLVYKELDFTYADNKPPILSSIDMLSIYWAGTSIWDAVCQTVDYVSAEAREDSTVTIIFLTDGEDTTSENTYDNALLYAQASRIPCAFYTIGAGPEVEENRLKELSDKTGGEYWHITEGAELPETFKEVFRAITEPVTELGIYLIIPLVFLITGGGIMAYGLKKGKKRK